VSAPHPLPLELVDGALAAFKAALATEPGPARVEVRLPGGGVLALVYAPDATLVLKAPEGRGLSMMEGNIVEALGELPPGGTLTGEELSRKAGYTYNSRFRHDLAALTRRGVIVNDRPGYRLP
jgi:hypothetical protein